MQRTRHPLWTATLSVVALGPLALSLAACSKEEAQPGSGEQAAAHADGKETPPAESDAGAAAHGAPASAGEAGSSEGQEGHGAEAPAKAEGEAAEGAKPAEADAGEKSEHGDAKGDAPKEDAPKEGDEKEAAATGSDEKPAAEEGHADAKKSSKKKGDKKEEAPAKEAKPKFAELAVKVTKPGQGTAATEGSTVTLHYKASVADAEKPFDSTFATRRPIEVRLGEGAKLAVIEGLRRGLEGLTPGTEARLEIPASLAWGEKGNPAVGVPANADVVFEISVLDVR